MATRQRTLTVLATIHQRFEAELRAVLGRIDGDVRSGRLAAADRAFFPFADLTSVHFARIVLLDRMEDHSSRPRLLLMTLQFDGELDDQLLMLAGTASEALDALFGCCEGYPPVGACSDARIADYLRRRLLDAGAFYVGAVGVTVGDVHRDERIRQAVERLADAHAGGNGADPVALRAAIRSGLVAEGLIAADETPGSAPQRIFDWRREARLLPLLVGWLGGSFLAAFLLRRFLGLPALLGFFGTAAALLGLAVWYLRRLEKSELLSDWQQLEHRCDRQMRILLAREDEQAQNQMNALIEVKAGWFRMLLLRTLLHAVDTLARLRFYRGSLFGIRGIHFAHWVIIPGERRLLFVSNYDGGWESYLDDFIGGGASGLTAIWSNTVDFPRTQWLLKWGAQAEHRFKIAVRANQLPSQVWYSAYPGLCVDRINRQRDIRREVAAARTERGGAEKFLALLR